MPPAKASKRKRLGKFLRNAFHQTRHDSEGSVSSSPPLHPVPEVNNISNSTVLGPDIPLNPSLLLGSVASPNTTHPGPNDTPDSSEIHKAYNSPNASAHAGSTTPSTSSQTPTSERVKEASSVAWNGLKTVLLVLEKSADIFPPLKSAVGGIRGCLDIIEAAAENRKDCEELSSELKTMANTLTRHVSLVTSDDLDNDILKSITAETTEIKKIQAHGKTRRIFESPQDKEDIIKRFRKIESLFRQLQTNISVRIWEATEKVQKMLSLSGVPSVDAAGYNSSYSTNIKRRACTEKTREKIRQDIKDWVDDPNGAKVYWMNGMAGTGKTTILYSLCKWLEMEQRLGGNFFCSRGLDLCYDVNNILPTLAFQLAHYSSSFQIALCAVLGKEPRAAKRDITYQFQKLILEPMKEVKDSSLEGAVVAIDALDECSDRAVVRLLLGLVLQHAGNLPIKFIITSRPEPEIRNKMLGPGFTTSILHLHDIEESIVEADIKRYLIEELRAMDPPPMSDQVEQLAKRAGKLFIYAATAVRYIDPGNSRVDSNHRLKTVLKTIASSERSKQHEHLDELYTGILSMVFSKDLEDRETEGVRLVLQTAICAKEPMSMQTLASLLGLEEHRVQLSLEMLRSVLHVQEGGGLVSTLHASFPDYMFDMKRSTGFYCDRNQHSEILANGCFDVMTSQLRFNICNLESSFIFDKDIADLDERIQTHISRGLSYACRYWGEHLYEGISTDAVCQKLVDFLIGRLLFWMEVLNLEGRMVVGGEILRLIRKWLDSSRIDMQKQVADAEAFVTRYTAGACTRSTPHIYISALPLCPRSSSVYKSYWGRTRGLINVKGSATEKWNSTAISIWSTNSSVNSIAFSPDGTRIASGSSDNSIRVWDARNGDTIAGPFKRHRRSVSSVAFSPDNTCIVSGSWDSTIQVWDARTGDIVAGPFIGHTESVSSVAFSPDGTRIASGSSDDTIRVWDARTGDIVAGPFTGHTHSVKSVAFSPDGTRIVSGSSDDTIRVWDARTGDIVARPFTGHTQSVRSVAFSPDNTRIVSGSSDETVRVWDACTGDMIAGPFTGHTKSVISVTFSPDGTRIVSGSSDDTIRVWDARTGNNVAGPFTGHSGDVRSVAFSPDGTRIVSGSEDKTIRFWDAHTGDAVGGPFTRHTSLVTSVAFSPDGTRIVSGLSDKTVRVWDACTGDVVAGPFTGHTKEVRSVAFSPDGTRIASGSYDKTIRVWDACTGDMVAGPFIGHTSRVTSVTFSPDSTYIVSGSYDKTIRVWNARTGGAVAGPFIGHTRVVDSVAFSPDSTYIVSGSWDQTIRVWDARTGNAIAGPFTGHTKSVSSVAFSPDGTRIVSSSWDETIRVWDARTGNTVAGPLTGHTFGVNSVAFSPDGTRIVSGSDDKTIRVWDARSGDTVTRPFTGHTSRVTSVAFSPDGTRILSGSGDTTTRLWDARTGSVESGYADVSLDSASPKHISYVQDFTFNEDGWMKADNVPVFWLPVYFRIQMPQPRNSVVIGPQGTTFVDYHNLSIGDAWSQCFVDRRGH